MMSTFPAMLPADGFPGTHFPAFEAGGFTPWEYQDNNNNNPFVFSPPEPIFSNSGLDHKTNSPNNSESTNPTPNHDVGETTVRIDERKRRRMISNRESARRSRMRKQRHLENLRNQLNRFKLGNRELTNRLWLVRHHGNLVRQENEWLRRESVVLQQKLWDIHQVLLVRQLLPPPAWPCNNFTSINEQIPPSLIT